MWYNKKRKLNEKRLSLFKSGDSITYELGERVVTNIVLFNDPDTKSISIINYSGSSLPFNYSNSRFNNIRALNPDPTDPGTLKDFLNTIIANVGQPITELQKDQAEDLIKSYKL